ncbi:MAG: hypothetical protein V4755_13485 [Curtobacterium sp.]
METSREQTVETLLVSVNRLIRTAVRSTGNTTSPAVWRTLGILETDQPLPRRRPPPPDPRAQTHQ